MAETIHSVHNYFTLGGSINMERVKAFLKRKQVVISVQTYLIDALGAMAFGLFASLLIGTIFARWGKNRRCNFYYDRSYAKSATGAALGVSIAYALKAPTLVLFSAATVGIAGNELGGPVGALVATIIAAELGKIVSKETPVDILVTPGVAIISGILAAQFVGPGVSAFMTAFGNLVKTATVMQPLFMGILVSALIGIALTLPISSAAICIMLSLDGLAGGAATAGCCAQMVGFAVLSFCENKWGGLLAQGTREPRCSRWEISSGTRKSGFHRHSLDGHRSALHDGLPSGKYSSRFRHGNLRSRRTDRHLHRHAGKWKFDDVAGHPAHLLRASGCFDPVLRRTLPESRMDQGRRFEAGSIIIAPCASNYPSFLSGICP